MQWNGEELITIIRLWGRNQTFWSAKTLIYVHLTGATNGTVSNFLFCVRNIFCFCSGNAPCVYSSVVKMTTFSDWLVRCCRCKSQCSFQCECLCAVCVRETIQAVQMSVYDDFVTYPLLIFSHPQYGLFSVHFTRDTFGSFAGILPKKGFKC